MRSPRTTTKSRPHSPQLEKALAQQQRPNAAKNKYKKKKLINKKKKAKQTTKTKAEQLVTLGERKNYPRKENSLSPAQHSWE